MIRSSILGLALIVVSFKGNSQSTDSLLAVLDTARNTSKVKTLNELFRATIQSDPVKAIGYTREALGLATDIEDKRGMAASYNNLGIAYKNQGVLDKALEYYIRSLTLYEEIGNQDGIATTKNNMASIYSIKGDFEAAKKNLEESYAQFSQGGDQRKIIGSLNNLGTLYSDLQLYDKAIELFSQAYDLSLKNGSPISDPLNNMGNVYFREGNYQRAVDYYLKALDIQRKENDRLGLLNTITNIGIAYCKSRQPKPSQQYLVEAQQLAKDLEAFSFMPSILRHMAENQYRLGQSAAAYLTFAQYDSAREKVYGQESSRNIAKMEMALGMQAKEKEFEMLKQESEIKSLQLRNSRLFITLLILGISIILASINFYYLGKRRKLV